MSIERCIAEQAEAVARIPEHEQMAKMGAADWLMEECMLRTRGQYQEFLYQKRIVSPAAGFEPLLPINHMLTDGEFRFQGDIARWAIRRGRAAIWAGTGLGKTGMELEWSRHIYDRTKERVILLCPLAVAEQVIEEAEKFGIEGVGVSRGEELFPITVTNYEMLGHFNSADFGAIVLDESGCIKDFAGKVTRSIIDFASTIPYRLTASATPAPNDFVEIGTQCEFLGIMSRTEMLATFFVHDGGDTSKWRLKKHAVEKFWEWVASWAVMLTKPADLGYPNGKFDLPPLEYRQHVVDAQWSADFLFPVEASTLDERRKARRDSLQERVDLACEIVCQSNEQWVVWCDLNDESAAIAKGIADCVEVRGSDTREHKVQASRDFKSGKARVIVSKPSIYGWGLNWQHCRNVMFVGLSDSFEAVYQAIRRCWRFGQTQPVNVHFITSELEGAVVRNQKRKEEQYIEMTQQMVKHMAAINSADIQSAARETETYERDRMFSTDGWWDAHLGDSCEILREMEPASVDYSIFSPPFASLYTYTNSERDLGNTRTMEEFLAHYEFIARELYRVLKPGRLLSFHCMQLPTSKERDGYIGLKDFRGQLIRIHEQYGFIYHSEVVIWKDPVTAMQRTKALGLLHKQIKKDSCMSRQGIPDYLVTMRKPGENEHPVDGKFEHYIGEDIPIGVTPGEERYSIEVWQRYASPVWMDINPSDTLQYRSARQQEDERHVCPLQLQVIERGLELWTNPGDLVLSPFMGIGSEGYVSLQAGRRFFGVELKRSYWEQACRNLANVRIQCGLFQS